MSKRGKEISIPAKKAQPSWRRSHLKKSSTQLAAKPLKKKAQRSCKKTGFYPDACRGGIPARQSRK